MIALGEIVIVGGGCYGGFYLEQLTRARAAGAIDWGRVIVVDRRADCPAAARVATVPAAAAVVAEWPDFFDRWLDPTTRTATDRIVPSPLMPHLFADWLARKAAAHWPRLHVDRPAVDDPVGTPFDMAHPSDGNRYLSHADWLCPVHCIEPATCPIIKAPRRWEMGDTVRSWAAATGRGAAVFTCGHVTHGVGMIPVEPILAAVTALDAEVARQGRAEWAVASVSSCHGALGLVRVAPPEAPGAREPAGTTDVVSGATEPTGLRDTV